MFEMLLNHYPRLYTEAVAAYNRDDYVYSCRISSWSEYISSRKYSTLGAAMGNCLGNERDTDSLLMCGEDGDRQCKAYVHQLRSEIGLNLLDKASYS